MQEAKNLLGKAQKKADSLSNAYLRQSVDRMFADYYLTTDQPDSAIAVLETSLDRYPESDQKVKKLNLLATAYRYQGKYQQSLQVYQRAKGLVDSAANPRTIAVINLNMAVVHEYLGNMGAAFNAYHEGLQFAESSTDSVFLATVLNNLGEAYNHQSNSKKAIYYLQQSIKVCESIGYQVGLLRSLNNLASAETGLGNYDSALSLYKRALNLSEKIRPQTPPFRITYNIGDLYLKKGDLGSARVQFQASLDYSRKAGIPQGIYYNFTGLGGVAEKQEDYAMALEYFRNALDIAQKIGSASFRQEANEHLFEVYQQQGNYEKALRYYKACRQIADSLRNEENKQALAKTESMINLRKEEEINQLLRDKHQQQEARINTQNWLIGAGIFIIALILISLYLLYRSNAEKQRINFELEKQRNRLEELNKVRNKMLAIIAHDLRSPMASMQGMLYLIRNDDLSKEELQEMTARLEMSINQNISMMDNLLVWAQEQMSGLELNIEDVNAREVVEGIFENLELQASNKGISLHNNVSADVMVKADLNLMRLILRNLISNSIKFSGDGDEILVCSRTDGSGKILFEVHDTGIGIPEAKQKTLFTSDIESRRGTQDEKGSGLGLQLCKEFVEKQNGQIELESTGSEGTTFIFSLPKAS